MIEVEQLSKIYGAVYVVHGLDLSVAAGEIVGFLGPVLRRRQKPPLARQASHSARRAISGGQQDKTGSRRSG